MGTVLLVILCVFLLPIRPSLAQTAQPVELPDDYIPFTLHRAESELEGASFYLEGFTVSMSAAPETFADGFTVESIFSHVRNQGVTGTLKYPDGRTTEIEYEIVHHRGIEDIYMKSSLGYFLWEYMSVQDDSLSFAIYWWYCPPATALDLEILEAAEILLSNPGHWHQDDERKCKDDIEGNNWSLYCALKHASIEMAGEYNHRSAAVQTARLVIDELIPNHGFEHTLEDFNNSPSTTHDDVLHVLELARERLRQELQESPTSQQ